jgi:hypothetical protein
MPSKATPTGPLAQVPDEEPTRVLERKALDAAAPPADEGAAVSSPAGAPKVTGPLPPEAQVTQAFAAPELADAAAASFDAGLTAPEMPALGAAPRALPTAMPAATADDPAATNYYSPTPAANAGGAAAIPDEVDEEWSLADQPTVQMAPQVMAQVLPEAPPPMSAPPLAPAPPQRARVLHPLADQPTPPAEAHPPRPAFLETGEQDVWPPRPTPLPAPTPAPAGPPQPMPTPIPRPVVRSLPTGPTGPRIPSPTGRPPLQGQPAAYSSPRMRRLVELRLQRDAHHGGQRGPTDSVPVAQMVRQWWSDLLPGLANALDHQHEARESGMYPIPAHVSTPASALGDAFGRLTTVVRDLGGRAQAAASPALTRLHEFHEKAEHAAQAMVDKIEGSPMRQQGPLLGPGRLAVFFEQGVTVGQAQRLLMTNQARPMRLIPRRHGFLALVQPGRESAVSAQLKLHPYVRDVVFMEYGAGAQAAR